MTEKEYSKALAKNLIHFENDKIISASTRINNCDTNKIDITIETTQYRGIDFKIDKFKKFMDILFDDNNPFKQETYWYLYQAIDKYLRIIVYDTPDDEMHQLADEHEIVGIKNIITDKYILF